MRDVAQQPPNTTIVEGGYGTITVGAGGNLFFRLTN